MPHFLITGPTGTGKTNLITIMGLDFIQKGYWLTMAFPHEKAGLEFIGELYARYGKAILDRLLVIDTRDMKKTVMMRFILSSTKEDKLERMQENDIYANAFMETVARRRKDITDIAEKPVLEKYTYFAARLAQNQDQWFPEWWLPYAFIPKHPIFKYLLAHCSDEDVRREMELFKLFPVREQVSILDPIFRLLGGVLLRPPVIACTSKPVTFDKAAHLDKGGITVILGGASDEATSVVIGSDFQQTMFLAKQGLKRKGVYIVDEAINFKLIGSFESKILSTIRWKGVSVGYVTQSHDFPSDEIKSNVLQNTDHYWFRQGTSEMAKAAAEDMLGALNEYKVHHVNETERLIPTHRPITRVTKGISKNHDGKETHSENIAEAFETVYERETQQQNVYQTSGEQVVWLAQKVQQLPIGTCHVREQNRAPYEYGVPLLPDSWAFPGLKEKRIEECLTLLKQRPEYVEPKIQMPEPITTRMQKNATQGRGNS